MRHTRGHAALIALLSATLLSIARDASAQNPPTTATSGRGADTTAGRGGGGRGGGGGGGGGGQRGRGAALRVMSLTVPWTNGGAVPLKYTQAGAEVSPALSWSGAPDSTKSFVLLVTDLSVAAVGGADGPLHWLVWNIPGTATSLPEAVPQGPTLPGGIQQISMSGPYYRGPGAPATSMPHTYMFELFALDTTVVVPSENVAVQPTRTAVMAALAGHVRGKAYATGIYSRSK